MGNLYNKYRPITFDRVLGQKSIRKILENQVIKGEIKNCYLFAGSTGTGKSTCARIFANLINNGEGRPIEIDAASNSGVDNVRMIIKDAQERAIDGKYKIFIIDEAHGLTNTAWQALLKLVEEPPEFTVFIFCTTDPQKIPVTILNRVQRFDFSRVPTEDIIVHLDYVCQQEGYTNYKDSIHYIGRIVNGCVREALTLLDKCADFSTDLSMDNVLEALGHQSYDTFFSLTNNLLDGKEAEVLATIDDIYNQGGDLKLFVDRYLNFCVDTAKYSLFKSFDNINIPSSFVDQLQNIINFENPVRYYSYVMDKLLMLKNQLKNESNIKATVEVFFLQITRMQ